MEELEVTAWLLATALVALVSAASTIVVWVLVDRFSTLIREEREAHERVIDDLHDRLAAKSAPEYLTLRAKDAPTPPKARARTDAEEAAIEKRRKAGG